MRRTIAFLAACVALYAPVASADLVYPKGSLNTLLPTVVWAQYVRKSAGYINNLLKRLANGLGAVARARGTTAKATAAANVGKDNALVMQRMWEQGFIAAPDIISAYCVPRPDQEQWKDDIKRKRERAWCREWPDAHFC